MFDPRSLALSLIMGCLATGCYEATVDKGNFSSGTQLALDEEGRVWEYQGRIDRPNQGTRKKTKRALPDLDSLSDLEYGRIFRPVTIINGHEYKLADEHLEELGYRLRKEVSERESGGGPEGTVPREFLASIGEVADTTRLLPAAPAPVSDEKRIFGTDTRVNYAFFSHQYPWNNMGHLKGGRNCSAFKVHNNKTAVTAAHCFKEDGVWFNPMPTYAFGSRVSSAAPFPTSPSGGTNGTGMCYRLTIPGGYDDFLDVEVDFAVLSLSHTNSAFGNCPLNTFNVGFLGLKNTPSGTQHIMGYSGSGSPPTKGPPPGVMVGDPVFGIGTAHSNGSKIRGTDNIDTTQGQSGGPFILVEQQSNGEWWWFVTGVNTASWWYLFDYENVGPSMYPGFRNFIAEFGGL